VPASITPSARPVFAFFAGGFLGFLPAMSGLVYGLICLCLLRGIPIDFGVFWLETD
jgi:hypothetical protein